MSSAATQQVTIIVKIPTVFASNDSRWQLKIAMLALLDLRFFSSSAYMGEQSNEIIIVQRKMSSLANLMGNVCGRSNQIYSFVIKQAKGCHCVEAHYLIFLDNILVFCTTSSSSSSG